MKTKRAVVGVLAAAALTMGVVVPALAQSGAPADPETTAEAPASDRAERRAAHQEAFAAALAEELGLPVDEVTAAIEKVAEQHRAEMQATRDERFQDRLDAAVEAGELTQEQADELRESHERGERPFRGPDGSGRGDGAFGPGPGHGSGPGPGHGSGRGAHGRMGGPAMLDG
jgi:ABC-type phosphate/phosphonate transport system substrate-binding protein